jgi:hypothetical protein
MDALYQLSYLGPISLKIYHIQGRKSKNKNLGFILSPENSFKLQTHLPFNLKISSFKVMGGEGFEPPQAIGRQIYSLVHLSTLPTAQKYSLK